ncbi:hypothetical protein SB861_09170 [Paraburkholderia sp. SIMBA_049]
MFGDAVHQLRASDPERHIDLAINGGLRGVWDGPRLQQLLSNLVLNALRYGVQGNCCVAGTVSMSALSIAR